jgi:hypothetical protein
VSYVLGMVGGVIAVSSGNPQLYPAIGVLLAWLGSIPVSIWALKVALKKSHGGCRIAFVKDA